MKSITSAQIAISLWAIFIVAIGVLNLWDRSGAVPAEPIDVVALDDVSVVEEDSKVPAPCMSMPRVAGEKTVILRLDDVQAFAWPSTTRMMIEDAESRNAPLTLGIIPKNFSADTELVSYLKEHGCNHEFALHGFDHQSHGENGEIAEFEDLSYEVAKDRLAFGLQELAVVTDKKVETWIPPLNVHSTGTKEALTELGVNRWSTEGKALWDYDATTFSYDTNALTPTDKVLEDCESAFAEGDVCIIMMHPQDFTTNDFHDAQKYDAHYLDLIDRLFGRGYGFGTFEDVA